MIRHALAVMLLAAPALGQGVYGKTATVVDGGHRIDAQTDGLWSRMPSAIFADCVLWQSFSYQDNSGNDYYDLSTAGNDGTQTTANSRPSFSTAAGGVYDFDGTDDYIDIGVTGLGSGAFTICAWINRDSITTGDGIVVTYDGPAGIGGRDGWVFRANNDDIQLYGIDDAAILIGRQVLNQSVKETWQFVAAVWDGGSTCASIDIYLNGSVADNSDISCGGGVPPTSTNTTLIGASRNAAGLTDFNAGIIDDIRIYAVALTATQVTNMYDATRGMYGL